MKLGIIGSGKIVADFLTIAGDLPDTELAAIFGTERSISKMEVMKNNYGIGKIYTDYEECLQDSDIDTVYIALPNHLHYSFTKDALLRGKNVICEKPFTLKFSEFTELRNIAKENHLILIEAITTQYLSNYLSIKESINALGDLKIIECNYSQYSSRYDAFKKGEILPAFNPKAGGGALMDINIYNIHFVVGILGKPNSVTYLANVERDIDTSGILLLNYPTCKVVCIGAKDSTAPIRSLIQGDKGSIVLNGAANVCDSFELNMNGEDRRIIDNKVHPHRMFEEFCEFARIFKESDYTKANDMLEQSQMVMEVVEEALLDAGIKLG
ncbi:Gfo/Idh/MocA family protein [Neobacillus cucumis]|uniref:Gfo/Idh/MocA family protein n=1 Tax=Neobacillus cucumis TaxID=1740721 RepID=UPI0028531745|nr:Gfo/Idh/MocA family oxidoreductase [Neobacillus cucumis]MDR4948889.1 Gfo/Idh/MocA family oxidoreductase [Neobacillus cucumis]